MSETAKSNGEVNLSILESLTSENIDHLRDVVLSFLNKENKKSSSVNTTLDFPDKTVLLHAQKNAIGKFDIQINIAYGEKPEENFQEEDEEDEE